jgi:AcrR family transcriptional regulator
MTATESRTAGTATTAVPADRPAQRLLESASKLFASQGIRSVGIDQILREARVAKASLYSTYGSKEALVIAYLTDLDQSDRNRYAQAIAKEGDPAAKVLLFFDLAATAARKRDFRGCLYANAATEFPGVELAPVTEHRRWMRDVVTGHLTDAGCRQPAAVAVQVQTVYDGALVGSKLERSVAPILTGRELAEALIARKPV